MGVIASGLAAVGLTQLVSEVVHWRVGAAFVPPDTPARPLAVVVLGYPSRRSGAPHPVQRWRVAQALRAAERYQADRVVFCGAAVRNQWVEANEMAKLALAGGLDPLLVDREASSVSTWENVDHASRRLPEAASVLIVSDPMHAARARRYWLQQRPTDLGRVFVSRVAPWYSGWWIKAPSALVELGRLIDERRRGARGRDDGTTTH